MNFSSDNANGVSPEIMAALQAANSGAAMAYGADDITARLEAALGALFETPVMAFPVATGTAANALALSTLCPPFGSVYCHAEAHIAVDECGAPELYTGGGKLVLLPGDHGRIEPAVLEAALAGAGAGDQHHVQPAALSLTQATEAGTVYTPGQVAELSAIARAHELKVHMDGARFANAVQRLKCSAADLTWRAGIDVLSFGATKNGAMAAEAVVFFDPALAADFLYRRKRGGHLFSKMRFLSAQLQAYVQDGLWLRSAAHANGMALRLAEGLNNIVGAGLVHPVEANEIFVRLPDRVVADLRRQGFLFHGWATPEGQVVRLVTAFNTQPEEVDAFLDAVRKSASAAD